jgi:dTDP-4-amino-4,6-dideoxygalactose transaminase
MSYIPFLRPKLVTADEVLPYLRRIDESRIYANFGPLNAEFERRILEEYFEGLGSVTSVHNATVGLMLAIDAVKRPSGRYAVMPSFTFAATPQAALWCGLEPYFVDIRAGDFCADEQVIAEVVGRLGDDVAVVVPYAAFGSACSLAVYSDLHNHGVPVVVDAAASFGTSDLGRQFGAGFPGLVVFSFHATKAFGIGEGGIVYSADTRCLDRVRRASNFSFLSSRASERRGLNGKLSEYGAAVGLATMDVYRGKVAARQSVYRAYEVALRERGMFDRGWSLQKIRGEVPHQFMGVLCPEGFVNDDCVTILEAREIQARTYFSPACHQQPAFEAFPATSLAVTNKISRRILNLPLWEDLQVADVLRVVDAIASI